MKYQVYVYSNCQFDVVVEAESEKEAEKKAIQMAKNEYTFFAIAYKIKTIKEIDDGKGK